MNFFNLFTEIETSDPEGYEELTNRREIVKKFTGKAGKIALAAVPVALASLFNKAYAGSGLSTSRVMTILNYALTLEYLEEEFYHTALLEKSLIPTGKEFEVFNTIRHHELEHVELLQKTIKSLGGTPVASPKFDYTAGSGSGNGPLADVFTNYETFLAVAQVFEDTGVRAYKGQAPFFVKGGALLTALLEVHSVEARHASAVRQLRYDNAFATVKPWITLGQPGISSAFNTEYGGEQNTIQAGVQITDINGFNISDEAASEAFDEPLSITRVENIVKPFLAQ